MLVQCWPAVYDVGPTFSQSCAGASYSPGMCINILFYIPGTVTEARVHITETWVHTTEARVHITETWVHITETRVHVTESWVEITENQVHVTW